MEEKLNRVTRDFISEEPRQYKYRIGSLVASSLSGFLAGVVFTTIAFFIIMKFYKMFHP